MARQSRVENRGADVTGNETVEGIDTGTGVNDARSRGNHDAAGFDVESAQAETEDVALSLVDLEAPTVEDLPAVESPGPARRSRRGGRRPGAGRKPASSTPRTAAQRAPAPKAAPTLDGQSAAVLLAMAQGGLMMAYGPRAAMTDFERGLIEPPMARMLRRMSPEAAVKVAAFADPLMLGIGIVVYATRLRAGGPGPGSTASPNGATAPAPTASAATGTRSPGSGASAAPGRSPNGATRASEYTVAGVRSVPGDLHAQMGGPI